MNLTARLALLCLLTLALLTIAVFTEAIAQDPAFHSFADEHRFAGIPNFWNVMSNLPFVLIGIYGMVLVSRHKTSLSIGLIYSSLFIGILLTGIGSAYYHYNPDNDTLVYDRIPMTIVFMSFLSATIFEYISMKAGIRLLFPLLALGIFSVLWWHYTERTGAGDLRLYLLVQFYPVIFIPLIILLFPSQDKRRVLWLFLWIIIWYIIAKLLEKFDKEVFSAIEVISGHSLKHLAAAVSTWYIVKLFRIKFTRPSATSPGWQVQP